MKLYIVNSLFWGKIYILGEKMQELEKRRRDLQLGGDSAAAAACSYHGPSSAASKTTGQLANDSYNKNKIALLVGGGTSLFIPTLPVQGGGSGSYGGCRQLINNYSFTDSINPNNGGDGSIIGKEAGGSSSGSGGCHQLINNYSFTGSTSTHPNNGGSSGNVIEKEGGGGGNNGGSSQVINNYSYTGSPSMNPNNDSSDNLIGKEGGGGSGGSNHGGCHEPTTNYSYIGSPSINTSNGGNGGVTGNEGGGFPTMELPNVVVTTTSNTSPSLPTNNPHPQQLPTLNQVWPYNFFSS
ncbi:hypothetical protein DM860_006837 [Cuscuta australis]|uniref:Uncharacterized protein n=1 Tax=Cuscuta australis TaxID=267555 RepID=A0A328E593_9ASTE|nr:hypothetical protein DM860_006837 [Cuscuta australis]